MGKIYPPQVHEGTMRRQNTMRRNWSPQGYLALNLLTLKGEGFRDLTNYGYNLKDKVIVI